jgi:glutathione S-transferase
MSSLKPITLYSHAGGPNPWKVAIVLNELGVPYNSTFPKVKEQPYLSINPNGRAPAIEDPNTGITLWESAAIVKYLIDTYDKDGKISYSSSPEKYLQDQWLAFQISGQGPYFGQVSLTAPSAMRPG